MFYKFYKSNEKNQIMKKTKQMNKVDSKGRKDK